MKILPSTKLWLSSINQVHAHFLYVLHSFRSWPRYPHLHKSPSRRRTIAHTYTAYFLFPPVVWLEQVLAVKGSNEGMKLPWWSVGLWAAFPCVSPIVSWFDEFMQFEGYYRCFKLHRNLRSKLSGYASKRCSMISLQQSVLPKHARMRG